MKKLLVCVLVTLCVACQTYSAVPFAGVRPGNDVRLTVTNEGSLSVASTVGRNVAWVEGRVKSVDTSGVTLVVESVNRGEDIDEKVDSSTVRLASSGISAAELRSFDKPKSFLVAGLITAGAVAAAAASSAAGFFGLGHGGSGGSR
jgi:hypothetical protein